MESTVTGMHSYSFHLTQRSARDTSFFIFQGTVKGCFKDTYDSERWTSHCKNNNNNKITGSLAGAKIFVKN